MIETFEFIRDFEGEVPGASAKDCGNYLDMNLPMAKYLAGKFLDEVLYRYQARQTYLSTVTFYSIIAILINNTPKKISIVFFRQKKQKLTGHYPLQLLLLLYISVNIFPKKPLLYLS